MSGVPSLSEPGVAAAPVDAGDLERLIRRDQRAALQRSLLLTIPVNFMLGGMTFAVAAHHGQTATGAIWFAIITVTALVRFAHCGGYWRRGREDSLATIDRDLWWAKYLALWTGLVWACTPFLATQPTSPDAVFYLIVGAGISAGSIAMGFAYAPVATYFVTPTVISNALALLLTGTFAGICLAATFLVYFAALLRSAYQGQLSFRTTARLKYEATALAASLREAHAQTVSVAEEMTHRARHDSLTGLLNRAGFLEEFEQRCEKTARTCCLMLLDLDGFKSINDTFGHKVGDQVLIEMAQRVRRVLPAGAAVARLGGDEFAVAFEAGAGTETPGDIADRLLATVEARFTPFDAGRLGISIGIYVGSWSAGEDILVYADEALYAAKSGGGNRHRVFDDTLRQRLERRRDSERDLLEALENGRLQVWYQPIFGRGGQRLAGVEALLRWSHPNHGLMPPSEVIAAAGLAGHAEHLLGFIVDQSLAMAAQLRARGHGDVTVSVNVSPRELSQLPVDRLILDRVAAAGLPATVLEIEVTEEAALDIRAVQGKLAALSAAGIRIAIDDFGVGYSSLANLRQLHADRIKIDRCFVTGLASSPDNQMLVQAVVSLGRAMKLDVVAEGVESNEDVLVLRSLGCQFMQGYHLGRPQEAASLLEALAVDRPGDRPSAASAA